MPNPKRAEEYVTDVYEFLVDKPVTFFRNTIDGLRKQNKPAYYHRQYSRVPTIDQCYTDDLMCFYEADVQYKRDRTVDDQIVRLLQRKMTECEVREGDNAVLNCQEAIRIHTKAIDLYTLKYGDLGAGHNCRDALMKQKRRMLEERRGASRAQGSLE